ncbi:MAG TPA: type VI secretion system tip protein TssI/VgrG, partial [Polyangiaceae bacterium]|nr:type VI secretion system tip protein TssI/VgrG [Polyangiaceae bacterium]
MSARPSSLFTAGEPLLLTPPDGVKGLHPISLVLNEELGRPYEIELELVSTQGHIAPQLLLGKPVGIHLNRGNDQVRHFHGLVSELRFLGNSGARARYRATLRPWLWFLSRTLECRVFQNLSVPDIIKEVFQGYGQFADFEEAPRVGKYPPRDFVVQYRESDLAFVSRLMEDVGLYYYFRQQADKHTLVLCDDEGAHQMAPGCGALPHRALGKEQREHEEQIDHFATLSRVDAGTYSITHFDYQRPLNLLRASVFDEATHEPVALAVYDYPSTFDLDQALPLTRLAVERQRCHTERYEGQSNSRSLGCGQLFAMTEHDTELFNTKYLVVSQTLVVHAHDLASGSESKAELVRCGFVAQLASEPFRLARSTPRPVVMGAQTAIVSGPEGSEIWTDGSGRVQVRFHWDRSRATAKATSCWIRVSQAWAGAGFGAMHLPRVGQEVVVEFLDGDPDRPIIVGRVYNGTHESPYAQHPTQSGIRSATLGGKPMNYNELRFDDKSGAEELYLQAERDHRVLVKHQRKVEIGDADELIVGANRTVSVASGMQLAVGALQCEEPPATGCLEISAQECIELRVGHSVLRIKGDRIELESGGKAQLLLTE